LSCALIGRMPELMNTVAMSAVGSRRMCLSGKKVY
jgi:hypothetical protein